MLRSAPTRLAALAISAFALPTIILVAAPPAPTGPTQTSVSEGALRQDPVPPVDDPATETAAKASETSANDAAVQPKPTSWSPFDLAREVNKARRRAERDERPCEFDFGALWSDLGIPPAYFDRAFTTAETDAVDLDGEPGSEALVKLTDPFYCCRYLVFKRRAEDADGDWLFLGRIDHDFNKYEMSSHRTLRPGGVPFLVIRGQTGSGTGFSSYAETWYRIDAQGIRRVLEYTAEGHEAPWPCGLGRELHTKVIVDESNRGAPSFRLRCALEFTTLDYLRDEYIHLITVRRSARFVWNEASSSFEFDASGSAISAEELGSAFDFVDGSSEAAHEFCLRELDKGVVADAQARRERLDHFEQDCDERCETLFRRPPS